MIFMKTKIDLKAFIKLFYKIDVPLIANAL